jgi:hypothetical protein
MSVILNDDPVIPDDGKGSEKLLLSSHYEDNDNNHITFSLSFGYCIEGSKERKVPAGNIY